MEFGFIIQELVRLFKPHTYVELGVFNGETFNAIAKMEEVKRAVAVDKDFIDFTVFDLPKVEKYKMLTSEFIKLWKDPIDLLFIDADHRKASVIADFEGLLPFVRVGTGLILLHDTHPISPLLFADHFCSDAWEAVVEIRAKYKDLEIVTLPGPQAGMSIIRKLGMHHLAWMIG